MAQQEEGWPLGLQPLNARVGLVRNHDFSGSTSFNTLLSSSPTSSTDYSSDLDTESTGSFFHDRSTTLGSLIGVSSIINLSRRSIRRRNNHPESNSSGKKSCTKSKPWCFSLCPTDTTDAKSVDQTAPSLGQFLEVERRAATEHRRSHSPLVYGHDELEVALPCRESNTLFVDGCVAPPRSSSSLSSSADGYGASLMFPCMCGQPAN